MAAKRTPDILRSIAQHQAGLDRSGKRTVSLMVRRYGQAWRAIQTDLERLVVRIDSASAAGEVISPAWLAQERRYRMLLEQVEEQINGFASDGYRTTVAAHEDAVSAAQRNAGALVKAGTRASGLDVSFGRLPEVAVRNIAGMVRPGSPVQRLFGSLGHTAREQVADAFVSGVVRGHNPRLIAREVQRVTGVPLSRAMTIARTETLRAYREASRSTYVANQKVVGGWVWLSALDRRGCSACWAQHGTTHELSESMGCHPNCRCAMVPIVDGWTPPIVPGVNQFETLSDAEKRTILGPAKFRAYEDGAVGLADLVKHSHSPVWGAAASEHSLVGVLGGDAAQYYRP